MTPEQYRAELAKKKRLLRTVYNSYPVKIDINLVIKQHITLCKIPHTDNLKAVDCMIMRLHVFASKWMTT